MIKFLKNNLLLLIGIPVGAIAGYLYWYHIGCLSGSCSITSKPLNSTMYGAVLGGLIFSMFKKEKNKDH